ncbi:MAG: GNAT family protein [Proteobacteria bacterium]|nr:GNAT family protein [Pseudomonadota bacterium]
MPLLTTDRCRLVPITLEMLEAVLAHDKPRAEALLGAQFPGDWPNDDLVARAFPYSRSAIRAAPELRLWGDSFVLDREEPRVIGSVVFHGHPAGHASRYSSPVLDEPGEEGVAEVAYGIEEGSRGQGYAVEAVRACVEWALAQDGIVAVQATTFAWHAASLGVIQRLGMVPVGTRPSPTFGELLVFERRR